MPKEKTVENVINDDVETHEAVLPDSGETVKLAKLKYSQTKHVSRMEDPWERNDASLLMSMENAGEEKDQEWLDNLTLDDVVALSNKFGDVAGGGEVPLQAWLEEKHPSVLSEYERETGAATRRRGSRPLSGSSTRTTA